ncbi:50S ribosomal protein L9 [Helicobacter sp. 13S00401-1]|uniref:50S ribosomal protein L9 n=1 Tax=Helicobacter sp. 13S00401-1 TaxID=1905758 RepID=UPI000BA6CA97|nr:50S ribosomal protein L9 [Helicobacter sp. 13S00401-1]PAF49670.1 50S ribosomal protein L9 [Helicobacter sp. 13S00401-1]
MKVLLLKDVVSLGKAGDIVEVAGGYAQNFLIPKNLAKLATNEVINKYKADIKRKEEKLALETQLAKNQAKELEHIKLTMAKKVGSNNHLFGSLTKDEVASELEKQHRIVLDKKNLEIPPIKTLGTYEVVAKLGHGLNASFKVEVIQE